MFQWFEEVLESTENFYTSKSNSDARRRNIFFVFQGPPVARTGP